MSNPTNIFDVRINLIDIDPDRFGRLRPAVFFDNRIYKGHFVKEAHLTSLAQLTTREYAIGDRVELRMIGPHPSLGPILQTAPIESRRHISTNPTHCRHCNQGLVRRHGELYCPGENCPLTAFSRTLYAARPEVLDLPMGRDMLDDLIWGKEAFTDLTGLLFLKEDHFEGTAYHADEVEVVMDALRQRLDQLFGRGYPQEVQQLAQLRFLDALSINGLHRKNLKRLHEKLCTHGWVWGELPQVLIDHDALRRFGISRLEVPLIVSHAQARISELDCIAREF